MNRDEIYEAASLEGDENQAISELEGKDGDITLDDLRTLPGAAGLEDAELQSMWDEVQKEQAASGAAATTEADKVAAAVGGETAVKTERGWKVYGEDGKEIADLSKLTADQFLKSKIGYNANKAEHKKNIDELIRVAQYGHLNEGKLSRVQQERDEFYKQVTALQPQLEQASKINTAVRYAMTQFAIGNDKPLSDLINSFKSNMGGNGEAAAAMPSAAAPSRSPSDDAAEREGMRVWYEEIQPQAVSVAKRYGAIEKEVIAAVSKFTETEPHLTREKLDAYINEEIPFMLEQAGYKATGQVQTGTTGKSSSEIEELRKQIAELKAASTNGTVEAIRAKNRKLPGSNRGEAGDTNVETEMAIPAEALKSKAAYQKFIRGE